MLAAVLGLLEQEPEAFLQGNGAQVDDGSGGDRIAHPAASGRAQSSGTGRQRMRRATVSTDGHY